MPRTGPRVFTIPPGAAFLPTLADALFDGRFGPVDFLADPLALADVTILLPTRRAARSLREAIMARLGRGAAILPAIRPIGDVDEDEHLLEAAAEDPAGRLALPQAIGRLERQLILTQLTLAWGRAVRTELLRLGPDEPLLVPASAADAFRLAGDLARLVDDVATAGIDWARFETLVPEELAGYWRITLDFLKIVAATWPEILAARRLADPAIRRDLLIRAEAARLAANPPRGLVIAAGSTGSIPATAELLATIARLPNGAVVLPGLDLDLDADGWTAIGGPDDRESAPGHPQYGLRQLLATIGIERDAVEALADAGPTAAARARLISEALRPAETTDRWGEAAPVQAEAFADLTLLVARTEQEEALAIALALREALETPGATAALITPDRTLARRVAVELGRFGLSIDDSGGRPLATTPAGAFARLVVAAARSAGEPVDLLALAKHPLARFGLDRAACRQAIRTLELVLFRGRLLPGGLAGLGAALAEARRDASDPDKRTPRAVRRLSPADWDRAEDLAGRIAAALAPLAALLDSASRTDAAAATTGLAEALRAAARDEAGDLSGLFDEEAGEALAGLLAGLMGEDAASIGMAGSDYPAFLDAAMAGIAVAGRPGADPRLFLWGTLEARLQTADLMVLGGLDEGVWPAATRTDPWLSRTMRAELGLEPPERRLGLSAHDFASALAARRVIVTRAEKRGGTPTVAARWLQRLLARLGAEAGARMLAGGQCYLDWARALDRADGPAEPVHRPAPVPPVAARPRRLSVTEIETLVRDPYAIYARHVLGLEALDPIGVAPDLALRGTLIHEALGKFAKAWSGPFDHDAEIELLRFGRKEFAPLEAFPAVHALWWPRFCAIAHWYVGWEASRAGSIKDRHPEVSGRLEVNAPAGPFLLTGRADRIDLRRDGGVDILDFKTGSPPTAKQLSTGLAPQLALEAAMVQGGGFGNDLAGRPIATLGWIGLGKVGKGEPFSSAVQNGRTADELGREAAERLGALIAAYDDAGRAYLSRARPMFETRYESPYDHLARVREWALADPGDDTGGGAA